MDHKQRFDDVTRLFELARWIKKLEKDNQTYLDLIKEYQKLYLKTKNDYVNSEKQSIHERKN